MPECYDGPIRIQPSPDRGVPRRIPNGSMTAAGALIGVTQPAISRLIRDLEGEIGWRLFDRSAGKLIPTPDAVALFRRYSGAITGSIGLPTPRLSLAGGVKENCALLLCRSVLPRPAAGGNSVPRGLARSAFVAAHRFLARGVGPRRDATL
jgi:hypothetical protein